MSAVKMNRRSLLQATVAGGFALSTLAKGEEEKTKKGILGAHRRFSLGLIGCGNRGSTLLDAALVNPKLQVIAACDVDEDRLNKNVARLDGNAKGYKDYRRLLDRKDIDGVIIATPDHWHALTTIDACNAGKHVYCEKPLSKTVTEGRAMIEVARKSKRLVQVGTCQRTNNFRQYQSSGNRGAAPMRSAPRGGGGGRR